MSIASHKPVVDLIPRLWPRLHMGIQLRLFLLQVSLFAFLMVILAGTQVYVLQQVVRQEYGERALLISRTVAQIPSVVAAFDDEVLSIGV